jgi:hypothetical protein
LMGVGPTNATVLVASIGDLGLEPRMNADLVDAGNFGSCVVRAVAGFVWPTYVAVPTGPILKRAGRSARRDRADPG